MDKFLPLKEFNSNGRALVFLIWEREFGESSEKLNLVCIHSSRELAEIRVKGLNSKSFWGKEDFVKSKIYSYEEVEVDHLFASIELGYDLELARIESQVVSHSMALYMANRRYNDLFNKSKEKIHALEAEIKQLKGE